MKHHFNCGTGLGQNCKLAAFHRGVEVTDQPSLNAAGRPSSDPSTLCSTVSAALTAHLHVTVSSEAEAVFVFNTRSLRRPQVGVYQSSVLLLLCW